MGSTDSEFDRRQEEMEIESKALHLAKLMIDQTENLEAAIHEARKQYLVHKRAKEILEGLGG